MGSLQRFGAAEKPKHVVCYIGESSSAIVPETLTHITIKTSYYGDDPYLCAFKEKQNIGDDARGFEP